MEKFMYLFRGGATQQGVPLEDQQAHLERWMQWMQMLAKNGTMLAGEPLEITGKQINGKGKVVTDGPFIEAKELVGGYLIVNAKDMNEAIEIARGCPIFEFDGKLEIRPVQKRDLV